MQKSETIGVAASENKTFFRTLAIFICSKVVVSYQRKKSCKNLNFYPILTIKYSIPTKMTMASSNMPSKNIFSHFLKFLFFWYKMLSQKHEKSVFFKKSLKSCSNQIVSPKHTFSACSEWFSCLKLKLYTFWEKWKKKLFSYKKTVIFVAVFEKTQTFKKNKFSQTYIIGLPKQFTLIHSLLNYPNLLSKIEFLSHFFQKTWFFPVFPHFSHYKSTHNKILGKRSKSVSLELHFRPACQFLSYSIPTILRSALFPSK